MTPKQRYILLVTMVAGFMAPFMSTALNLAITDISTDLACGATSATWVINAYTLSTAMFSLPFGHLADMHGRRRYIIIGTATFAASSLLSAVAPNVYVLIFARVIMSIGTSAFLAGTIPLMLTYFKPEQKGRMLGIAVVATYMGLSLGPFLGGIITVFLSWRAIFLIGTACAVASLIVTCTKIEPDNIDTQTPFDMVGALLYMAGVALFMYGLSEWSSHAFAPILCGIGAVVLVAFVVYEARQENPVVQVRLFKSNPAYGLSNFACLLSFGACFAITYTMAIFLQNVAHLSALVSGVVLVVTPVMQALLSPYSGHLADRIAPQRIAVFGMAIIVASLVVFSFIGMYSPLWAVIIGLLLIGIGNTFFSTPNNTAILSCVDRAHYSEANSTISTMRGLGQSLSIAMVSMVFSMTIGNTVIAQVQTDLLASSIHTIVLICLAIAVVALLVSIISEKNKGKSQDL